MRQIIPQWFYVDNKLHLKRVKQPNTLCRLALLKVSIYSYKNLDYSNYKLLEFIKDSCENCYRIYLMECLAE